MDAGLSERRAEFFRAERTKKEWTQQQFADKIDVSSNAVSKWERGVSFPDVDHLIPIARVYGCSVEELLAGERKTADSTVPSSVSVEVSEELAGTIPLPEAPAGIQHCVEYVFSDRDDATVQEEVAGKEAVGETNTLPLPVTPRINLLPRIIKAVRAVLSFVGALTISIGVYALYCHFKPPTFEILDSFYGDADDTKYFDKAYCVIVEYSGNCDMEDVNAFSDGIEEKYEELYKEVDAIVIMFFEHYNPEIDYIATAKYCVNLLPPHID